MTIEEAIANNLGSIITGSVAVMASCITAFVSIWISRANHTRNLKKEKKAALLSRIEIALKEVIRWRNSINSYIADVENDAAYRKEIQSTEYLEETHEYSLRHIRNDDLLISIKLCANEKINNKYNEANEIFVNLMIYKLGCTTKFQMKQLHEIQVVLFENIDELLKVIECEMKKLIN